MHIAPEYVASIMDRPGNPNWTEEQLQRFAQCRAEQIANAAARAKAKINGTFSLAEPRRTVTFHVQDDTVTVTWQENRYSQRKAPAPVTMTRAEARIMYESFLNAGMKPF